MKQNFMKRGLVLSVLLLFVFVNACRREANENFTLPAYFIGESEMLTMPAAIDVPANQPNANSRVATYYADGVQKYKAQQVAGTDPATYQWVLVAPKADLYDASNKKVGTHTAGPTWQLSVADSIYAQQYAPAKSAPSPDPLSIDWLQLMPKTGTVPKGVFAGVTYIQRIATKGGKAPATAPVSSTDTVDVKYTAVYRFTRKNP